MLLSKYPVNVLSLFYFCRIYTSIAVMHILNTCWLTLCKLSQINDYLTLHIFLPVGLIIKVCYGFIPDEVSHFHETSFDYKYQNGFRVSFLMQVFSPATQIVKANPYI